MVFSNQVSSSFLTILFISLFIFHSDAAPNNYTRVNVSLYFESLCPFCGNFIVNQLGLVFETDLISIVNLRLIPWGNARRITNSSWTCQHGPDECLINTVEACAVHLWSDPVQLQAAYETEHLQPPHRFVPWVIVNNKTLEQDYQNYVTHICKAYTGPNRPGACSRTPEIIPSNIDTPVPQVCYARKTGNSSAPGEEKAGSAKKLWRKTKTWFMS
ncbi:gamma-interferon-responsive lysosomal thiol protein-like isoform X2 [Apium graveolens]|uniref:gamma-interferon-responsive lysosomal thiol protein-like isoform X2 n=1 Tax=Apium graveolens TaxID=4045 RepID=UPI003D7A14D3